MSADEDFIEGYRDGGDPNCPEPSTNRSACYRHSFKIRRAERAGKPIRADIARAMAEEAEREDAAQ